MSLFWTNVRLPCRAALSLVLLLTFGHPCADGVVLDAVSFQLPAPPSLTGNLASNNILLDAEQIHAGQVGAPHSYVPLGDNMYAVTDTGLVVNVAPCRPTVLANLRPIGCRTLQECGHLISLRLSQERLLVVLDAYRGVFEVHPLTGNVRQVYDSSTLVNGRPSLYLNDLVFMKDGTIIMSDASPTFNYDNEFWIRFEGRSDGRLIGVNPINGQAKEILAGIAYPTGLEVTDDGSALLVSEAGRARVLRIDLRKDKFFQRSFFSSNLPGMPEHIRKSGRSTYWIGLSYPRYQGDVSIMDQYCGKPASRNFLAGRRTMEQLKLMYTKRGLVIEVDESGRILRSVHDPTGLKVGEVLELTEYSGVLYVGTRTQRSTVRIVGSPNMLTVDSLVQVLRGRCKVSEDRVLEAKASVEQRLKEQQTMGHTMNNPLPPANGFPDGRSPGQQSGYQQPSRNNVDIGQGLFQLHRTLVNASAQVYRPPQGYSQFSQGPQGYYNFAPPNQQPVNPFVSANDHFPGRQNTQGINQFNQQQNSNPGNAFVDPFIPLNAPQGDIPLQKANRLPQGPITQQNTGSSNQPHVVHGLHEGQLVSHVILGKKAEAALSGNRFLTPQEEPQPILPQIRNDASAPSQTLQNQPNRMLQHQPNTKSYKNPPADLSTLGGFMGFLEVATPRPGATAVTSDQTSKQDPNIAISMPDHKLPGHLEPLHSINPSTPPQVEQSISGVQSFPNLEQFIGGVANSQGQSKQDQPFLNGPQSIASQSLSQQFANSFVGSPLKRPGVNIQDALNKEAITIQNVQMFHPTDSPGQVLQSQNYAGTKVGSTFQQKASLLKEGLQQLQKMFKENKPNHTYLSASPGQPQAQIISRQTEFNQNSPAQNTGVYKVGQAGLATDQKSQSLKLPSSHSLQEQSRPSQIEGTLRKSVYNMNDNVDVNKQQLISFSGAATIHPNQPANIVFDKRFQNIPPSSDTGQETEQSGTNFGVLTSRSVSHSVSPRPSSSHPLVQNPEPGHFITSPPGSISVPKDIGQQPALKDTVVPTGYIQLYQAPGQYILIPLTQSSLLQALNGLSTSQVQNAQIIKSNPQLLQPSPTGIYDQGALPNTPQEAAPLLNIPLLQPQSQHEQNQQNIPRENQSRNLQHSQTLQQQGHLQNQPIQQQSMLWTQQPVPSQQTYPALQMQSIQDNITHAAQYNDHISHFSEGDTTTSNLQKDHHSTMSLNNTITSKPAWFTHNSGQGHVQSTQQFTEQLNQPSQQFGQISEQFTHPTQQPNQFISKIAEPTTQFTSQFTQPNRLFTQTKQQFTQPTPQSTQTDQQSTQYTQRFMQPAQQFTQPTKQLNTQSVQDIIQQPTEQYSQHPTQQPFQHNYSTYLSTGSSTQPLTHQFVQPTSLQFHKQFSERQNEYTSDQSQQKRIQQSIQQFNEQSRIEQSSNITQSSPTQSNTLWTDQQSVQEQPQKMNAQSAKYSTEQSPQQINDQSTQFSTQQSPQQFNYQSTQFSIQQSSQQFNKQSTQISTQQSPQQSNDQSAQFSTQKSPQQLNDQSAQFSTHQSSQQFNDQSTKYSTQQTFQQLNDQSTKFSTQQSPQQLNDQSTQLSTQQSSQQLNDQSAQFSTQQSSQQLNDQSTQFSTQQSPQQLNDQTTKFSTQESPQQLNDQSTQFSTQQSSQQLNDQSTQFSTQQSSQQLNDQSTQFSTQQSSQQLNDQSTQFSTQQSPQQLNDHSTKFSTQQSSQQLNDQSTQFSTQHSSQQLNDQSTKYAIQQSPQQLNDQLPKHSTQQSPQQLNDQSIQFSTQQSPQQLNDQSSQQFNEQSTLFSTQQSSQQFNEQSNKYSTQQSPQQFNDQSTKYATQQAIQHDQSIKYSTQHSIRESPQQFNNQSIQQLTQSTQMLGHQLIQHINDQSTQQFTLQPTQQSSKQINTQSTQQSIQPTLQPIQPLTQQPTQDSSQRFNDQSIQGFTQQSTQQSPQQLNDQSIQNVSLQSSQQTSLQGNYQSTQDFMQLSTKQSSQQLNDQSTQYFTQQPTQQSPQQFNDETNEHFTQQQTQQSSQQLNDKSAQYFSQQPAQESSQQSNDQATQHFTQQPTQQLSQQFNYQTTQHFSQQPIQQLSQQFNDQATQHLTQQLTQTSSQQFNGQSDKQFTQQSNQLLHNQVNTQSTQRSIQPTIQPIQQLNQQSTQALNHSSQHSKHESKDQQTQFIQQPTQQLSIQMTSQSTHQSTQQPVTQELSTQQSTQQPAIQEFSAQQSMQQPTTQELMTQPKQRLSQHTLQQSTQQNTQPSIPVTLPTQHTSQSYFTTAAQTLTDNPQQLTHRAGQISTAQITEETNQRNDPVLQEI